MKQLLILVVSFLLPFTAMAQSSKQITWTFSAVKKEGFYEIQFKATIKGDYHIYAQNAGNGVGKPTSFKFNKNPLLTIDGAVKETGKLIKSKDQLNGKTVTSNYYSGTVTFTQKVKIKSGTSLTGSISYMVCNKTGCLPPSTTSFDIEIK
jgi:hypothetical protein